jgi:hypothetical protein
MRIDTPVIPTFSPQNPLISHPANPITMLKPMTLLVGALCCLSACRTEKKADANSRLFAKDNLIAWCVVPFDSVERSPEERAKMLHDLGFSRFAYDWRLKHLDAFDEEVIALKKYNIEMSSVWFWVDGDSGKVIDDTNERILNLIGDNGVHTELWICFNSGYFDGLTDGAKLEKAVSSVSYIRDRAKELGCSIALYNHGDWFGEPENQIRIIEAIGDNDVRIVYNFHHARHQADRFPVLLNNMLPYLSTVNLNGMSEQGPMILPLGQGDKELEMLTTLKASGFSGSIGILGHVEDADVRIILQQNLDGLKSLLQLMNEKEALATF